MNRIKSRIARDVTKNPILTSVVLVSIVFSILLVLILFSLHDTKVVSDQNRANENHINILVKEDSIINEKLTSYLAKFGPAGKEKFNTVCEDINGIRKVMVRVENNVYDSFIYLVSENKVSLSPAEIEKYVNSHTMIIKETEPLNCQFLANSGPKNLTSSNEKN